MQKSLYYAYPKLKLSKNSYLYDWSEFLDCPYREDIWTSIERKEKAKNV